MLYLNYFSVNQV